MLGICGGIAAYKSAVLARRLIDAGAEVRTVMTEGAQAFITPLTLQALTGQPVHADLLDPAAEAAMGHIELARWADRIVIAPATANTLARLAHGFASDLLSTLVLATDAPVTIAPAMNRLMWAHPATQANVAMLESRGVSVAGPDSGVQACGETGAGRMLEPEAIRDLVIGQAIASSASSSVEVPENAAVNTHVNSAVNSAQDPALDPAVHAAGSTPRNSAGRSLDNALDGLNVTITAGPTHEAIDPVRYLGNRSSGRMGYAVAAAAARRGARVTLISGPVSLDTPENIDRVDVVSAREMHAATLAAVNGTRTGVRADVFIAVAAVADFRVRDIATQKIKKRDIDATDKGARHAPVDGSHAGSHAGTHGNEHGNEHVNTRRNTHGDEVAGPTIELVRNPDILADVAALADAPFCVGFAAETESLAAHARTKLDRKRLDMIAANRVAQAGHEVFGSDTNSLDVFWPPDGHARVATATKTQVAEQLLDLIAMRYRETVAAARDSGRHSGQDNAVTATLDPDT